MSSKKPFDYIEDKIKEAAENSSPAFDDMAWQAMEAKLDGDDKKRRPFLWWFLLPLLIAGAGIVYYNLTKNSPKENVVAGTTKNTDKQKDEKGITATLENTDSSINNETVPPTNAIADANEKIIDKKIENITAKQDVVSADSKVSSASSPSIVKIKKTANRKKVNLSVSGSGGAAGMIEKGNAAADKKDQNKKELNKSVAENRDTEELTKKEIVIEELPDLVKEESREEKKQVEVKKIDTTKEENKPVIVKKEKEKIKKTNGFYVLATGGADAGNTKLFSFSNSSITPKYGVGFGYQFNKRWSVQTGFYTANKKYVAGPKDYTFKPGSPMQAYQIDKIKATSLVYEIPLTVKFDIVSKPSVIFYATAGMSSYILKNEKYNCFYHYYNIAYERAWEYADNKNFFSMANFSVGIEKKLSSQFSLLAEPSLSVPVSGVGDGKVKLYSTALQLGLKYYLFKK